MIFNNVDFDTYFKNYPDANGYFGKYGGAYISDELKKAMEEINEAYFTICKSAKFISELRRIRRDFQGRPTPISHLERLSNALGNVQLYVKREDLNHTGAHKLNHCMGEVLLAKFMGKITFWGEIDRQHLMVTGTEDDIEQAVTLAKDTLWDNGGCIAQLEFGPGGKPGNARKAFETWDKLTRT